ncbi:DUF5615 family PIN-like protein [uncultured Brevundimonas sp.]|uniref:DUF5615 family PIN-like protein n=1 Tax=uncultured Brevundimonas sp. TaxID=213418 RepID=UPI0026258CC2|nr:DUF5615 family PIN-like protein [uncultured Brevundimonas sp.]
MNFLIDECLHTSLVEVAIGRGHEGTHVNWRGWSGVQDWNLMQPILEEIFVFVTNNAKDFRRLHAGVELHAGLVILIPNVTPLLQRQLFDAALDEVDRDPDLVNQSLELDLEGDEIVLERHDLPAA